MGYFISVFGINYINEKYKDELFTTLVYVILNQTGEKVGIDEVKNMDLEQFKSVFDSLLKINTNDLENSIKDKISIKFENFINSQHKSIQLSNFLLMLFFLSLPFVEYFIYIKFYKSKENIPIK